MFSFQPTEHPSASLCSGCIYVGFFEKDLRIKRDPSETLRGLRSGLAVLPLVRRLRLGLTLRDLGKCRWLARSEAHRARIKESREDSLRTWSIVARFFFPLQYLSRFCGDSVPPERLNVLARPRPLFAVKHNRLSGVTVITGFTESRSSDGIISKHTVSEIRSFVTEPTCKPERIFQRNDLRLLHGTWMITF